MGKVKKSHIEGIKPWQLPPIWWQPFWVWPAIGPVWWSHQ